MLGKHFYIVWSKDSFLAIPQNKQPFGEKPSDETHFDNPQTEATLGQIDGNPDLCNWFLKFRRGLVKYKVYQFLLTDFDRPPMEIIV